MTRPQPVPLRPDFGALRAASVTALARACAAEMLAAYNRKNGTARDILSARWPLDRDAVRLLETRGAVSPATLSNYAPLRTVVADFLESLGPASAGAALLAEGLQLTFDRAASISVPAFTAAAGNVGCVEEATPIPVRQLNVLGGPMLEPDKLAVIAVLSSEMIESSNAEAMVRDCLTRSAALALDAALFDANAASAARPAGLRYGITALAASSAGDATEAMLADIATVAGAVAPVAGNAPIALIAAPTRAMMLRLRSPRELPVSVLSSSAVAAGDLIAVAPAALVSAVGEVQIEAGREMTVHMADPAQAISIPGSPNVVAVPVRNMWQTDCVGLRLHLTASWALRSPVGLAWTTATGW